MPDADQAVFKKKSQAETIDELINYLTTGGSLGLEIEKRLEGLPSKYVVLFQVEQEKQELVVSNIVKAFTKKKMPGIFVTLNRGGPDLIGMLEKNGVDCGSLFIVDAISKGGGKVEKNAKISYSDSPQDLTEMQAQIGDFIEIMPPGERFFVFDSLSTLLIYNAEKTVQRFVHLLGEKLRANGFKAVFTIMKETRPETMNILGQFVDSVVKTSPQISP